MYTNIPFIYRLVRLLSAIILALGLLSFGACTPTPVGSGGLPEEVSVLIARVNSLEARVASLEKANQTLIRQMTSPESEKQKLQNQSLITLCNEAKQTADNALDTANMCCSDNAARINQLEQAFSRGRYKRQSEQSEERYR